MMSAVLGYFGYVIVKKNDYPINLNVPNVCVCVCVCVLLNYVIIYTPSWFYFCVFDTSEVLHMYVCNLENKYV